MFKIVAAAVLLATLTACGTVPYTPQEYPLRAGLIPKLVVNGDVQVNNTQPLTTEAIVYSYGGTQFASNYKDITQLMVEQTKKEIAKNGQVASSGKPKTLDVKVNYLKSTYIAFYWKSEIKYTVTLGSSASVEKTVTHGSGNVIQDLNGCVAEGVMKLLNDPKVVAYLAE
jgi:hypothetical protein